MPNRAAIASSAATKSSSFAFACDEVVVFLLLLPVVVGCLVLKVVAVASMEWEVPIVVELVFE